MNRNLALEFVRVTEMAAIASARLMGRGDEKAADQAAVDAMRAMLDSVELGLAPGVLQRHQKQHVENPNT